MNRNGVVALSAGVAAVVAGIVGVGTLLARHPSNDSPPGVAIVPVPRPVPLLTPEEEVKTFRLPPGFKAEVVACEPMVQHPVEIEFDADGRMWVVEMRGYMPDVDGNGENEPVGEISVLEDTDGDGRMDKRTAFMEKLVLPRAIGLVRGGALVAVPPKLLFCKDTDGDLKADEKVEIAADYGISGNPEHQPNGLMVGMDNWVWNADYDKRFKFVGGKWVTDVVQDVGQWGISQDDTGRIYTNSNSDLLRSAVIPPSYATRNPNYRSIGSNVQVSKDQTVWPSHDTAQNRGYSKNYLREDGTLREFTAACAPVVYRGDLLPGEWVGNVFVCESSANVVRREVVTPDAQGTPVGKNAYEGKEFIASTYERFRPVNLANGPDGALYVVDMHHGLIQHTAFVTSYNIQQYLGRELDKHLRTGRIFRIVPEGGAGKTEQPQLSKKTTQELIPYLSHANGWWRDTAQRLIVERATGDRGAITALRKVATEGNNPLGRLHAIWTLEGIGGLNSPTLNAALGDADARVRAAAIRLCEPTLGSQRRENVLPRVLALESDKDPGVRLQFVLSVSEIGGPDADEALADVLVEASQSPLIRDAAITGLHGRELEYLRFLEGHANWSIGSAGQAAFVSGLAQCVVKQGDPKRINALLDVAAESPGWKAVAVLGGFPEVAGEQQGRRRAPARARPILMTAEPAALATLRATGEEKIAAGLERVTAVVHWPGKAGYVAPPPVKPLTPAEQARYNAGRGVYDMLCGQCHKPDGMGKDGLAPPLVNADWVLGSEQRLIRIAIGGLQGPITVDGKVYNLEMPAWKMLDDEKLAAALTYVRRSWGHTATAIDPGQVKAVREETAGRTQPWTERELLLVK